MGESRKSTTVRDNVRYRSERDRADMIERKIWRNRDREIKRERDNRERERGGRREILRKWVTIYSIVNIYFHNCCHKLEILLLLDKYESMILNINVE